MEGLPFRSEETVGGVKTPEDQRKIQVFRHKGQGEEQVRGESQDQKGKDNLPVFLQYPAGQKVAGDQGGGNEQRVESGNQLCAQDTV